MTVAELIIQLQAQDPNAIVYVEDGDREHQSKLQEIVVEGNTVVLK
jgi:hypothetical protein